MTGSPASYNEVLYQCMQCIGGRQAGRQESASRKCAVRTLLSDDGHAGQLKRVCICMQSSGKIWWICCRRDIYPHRQVACQLPHLFRYSDVSRTSPATQSNSIACIPSRPLSSKSISSYSSRPSISPNPSSHTKAIPHPPQPPLIPKRSRTEPNSTQRTPTPAQKAWVHGGESAEAEREHLLFSATCATLLATRCSTAAKATEPLPRWWYQSRSHFRCQGR